MIYSSTTDFLFYYNYSLKLIKMYTSKPYAKSYDQLFFIYDFYVFTYSVIVPL